MCENLALSEMKIHIYEFLPPPTQTHMLLYSFIKRMKLSSMVGALLVLRLMGNIDDEGDKQPPHMYTKEALQLRIWRVDP